jgi:large conductance mechanosensitive channel
MVKEFKEFIFKGNVLDLAVGIVIGVAFGAVVNSFVANLIMSPIAAVFGKPDFGELVLGPFRYGAFLTSLVQFVIIAAAIFFVVVKPANSMMKRMGMLKEPTPMRDCPSCLQSIPTAAKKCMYCTVDLTPGDA